MQSKRLSIHRSIAIEQTREVYERLYGERPSKASYDLLSAAELEALAERISQPPRWETDRVAVLGYN